MKRPLLGFAVGAAVATLAGLIGLGGAEFRLPLLKSLFSLPTLKAVIFNKATSLVVVMFALLFRAGEIPFALLVDHLGVILNLLAGSLIGAWVSAGKAMRMSQERLDTLIMLLLLGLALLLLFHHIIVEPGRGLLFDTLWVQAAAGIAAGFGIGAVAAILGVAGGELLIPTIVLLYGVDVKLAGSLSLAVSLPTMLVGFFRYSRGDAFAVLGEERGLLIAMVVGSIVGAFAGAMLLGLFPTEWLLYLLALLLMLSAFKIFRHRHA